MLLILKECKYRLWLLPFSAVAFEVCRYVVKGNDRMEMNYYIFPIIFCTLLLTRPDEIDLIRTSKTRLTAVLAIRYAVTYGLFVLYPVARLFVTQQQRAGRISVSLMTTLLFCTSFSLLFCVLLRNPYAAVIVSVVVHTLMLTVEYLIGRYLNEQAVRRLSPYYPNGIQNFGLYVNNRLIAAAAGLVVAGIGLYLFSRREKAMRE